MFDQKDVNRRGLKHVIVQSIAPKTNCSIVMNSYSDIDRKYIAIGTLLQNMHTMADGWYNEFEFTYAADKAILISNSVQVAEFCWIN